MDDDDLKRAYWRGQMEEAAEFVRRMREWPVEECGEPMVSMRAAAADLQGVRVDFSETLQAGKNPRVYFLRQGLIGNFKRVAAALHECGWWLKVMDGYRSPQMQRDLSHAPQFFDAVLKMVIWELKGNVPTAEMMFRRFSMLVATRCKVGTHVSGSAIDVAVFDRATGKEVDRGGEYPEMSVRSSMASPFVTPEQRRNRDEIEKIFVSCGWCAYPWEFWHYNAGDCFAEYLNGTGKPARYGAMVFDGEKVVPLSAEEADRALEPMEFYAREIEAALRRLRDSAPVDEP